MLNIASNSTKLSRYFNTTIPLNPTNYFNLGKIGLQMSFLVLFRPTLLTRVTGRSEYTRHFVAGVRCLD